MRSCALADPAGSKSPSTIAATSTAANLAVATRQAEDQPRRTRSADSGSIAHAVAIGALRYFLLRFTRSTVIAFDFKDALSFDGETLSYSGMPPSQFVGGVPVRIEPPVPV